MANQGMKSPQRHKLTGPHQAAISFRFWEIFILQHPADVVPRYTDSIHSGAVRLNMGMASAGIDGSYHRVTKVGWSA